MTSATRVSGPAPLSVVFDPIGVASGVVQPPGVDPNYATFSYSWVYGDPASGTWTHTGKSKNTSTAWIGAHVFETPGSYQVRLTVADETDSVYEYHQDITVTDPDAVFAARTFYVAAAPAGNDANPGTIGAPFLTAEHGITMAFAADGAARLRFRRGDTFTSATEWIFAGTGPRLIDAYGSGARPRIVFSGTNVGMRLQSAQDVRVCNLDVVSTSTTQPSFATGLTGGTQTLISGCTFDAFPFGLGSSYINELCAYESEFLNGSQYGIYLYGPDDTSGIHMAILGSRMSNAATHLLRTYISRSVIQGNKFENGGWTDMKLVGRELPNPSRYVCVVDNEIRSEVIDQLNIGPENATSAQHATHYLVEGNYFYSRQSGNQCIRQMGQDVTIRNNVFDIGINRRAIRVEPWGIGPVPARVVVEHNTAASVTNILYFLHSDSSDLTVNRNNLFYCPGGTVETPSGNVSSSGNVTAVTNLFATLAGIVGGEWDLTTSGSNAAVDVGSASLNRTDFVGRERPIGAGLDVGAFERQLGGITGTVLLHMAVLSVLESEVAVTGTVNIGLGLSNATLVPQAPPDGSLIAQVNLGFDLDGVLAGPIVGDGEIICVAFAGLTVQSTLAGGIVPGQAAPSIRGIGGATPPSEIPKPPPPGRGFPDMSNLWRGVRQFETRDGGTRKR